MPPFTKRSQALVPQGLGHEQRAQAQPPAGRRGESEAERGATPKARAGRQAAYRSKATSQRAHVFGLARLVGPRVVTDDELQT